MVGVKMSMFPSPTLLLLLLLVLLLLLHPLLTLPAMPMRLSMLFALKALLYVRHCVLHLIEQERHGAVVDA